MNMIASNRPFPDRVASNPEELEEVLDTSKPKYIFFPFWSWKVPNEILDKYICIGFHTGEQSGGSPIQNLIRNGEEWTKIKMFYMTSEIDKGKVIDTRNIYLYGTLEEILIRMTKLIMEMIDEFTKNNG